VDVVDHEPGPGQGATDYRQEVDQDADSFVTVAGSVAAASTEPAPTLAAGRERADHLSPPDTELPHLIRLRRWNTPLGLNASSILVALTVVIGYQAMPWILTALVTAHVGLTFATGS
jgi:hypothetical protein